MAWALVAERLNAYLGPAWPGPPWDGEQANTLAMAMALAQEGAGDVMEKLSHLPHVDLSEMQF